MNWAARLALLLLSLGACGAAERAHPDPAAAAGELLYLRGELPSGAPLKGMRAGGAVVEGEQAACANCHRRSGLGSMEGSFAIPPITAHYLYHDRTDTSTGEHALMYLENAHGDRPPYTDETLARAIREGLDSEGRALSVLMPRFTLSDAQMADLIAYLRELDRPRVPGVTATTLHFSTILTPDTDPVRRRAVVDVLNQYVADKNLFPFGPNPSMRTSGKTLYTKSMYVANRHWQLHVWELKGPPASWRAQLDADLAREPVLAVISGLGGGDWSPVHDFCEQRRVPCLFPNLDAPPVTAGDFYSVYLSKGVLLEAELISAAIASDPRGSSGKVVRQVYRAGDVGETAAHALASLLEQAGVEVKEKRLGPGASVAAAIRGGSADVWVLWLRPVDLAALGEPPPDPAALYVSGQMGGLEEAPLPAAWRKRARLAYPVDLPDKRVVRVDYPLGWFKLRQFAVVDPRLQADTYLACGILSETLKRMSDAIVPEYLVEQLQQTLEHRILTGYYPRLSLAPGQTVGSKGAYWVRFADAAGPRVVADSPWITP